VLYVGLIYAFSFDVLLFGESFNRMELIGIGIVLTFTGALTIWNLCTYNTRNVVGAEKAKKDAEANKGK
jgi:drug/metabolite transporter (DMT)-like permease